MEISHFYHVTSAAWYAVRWTGAWVLSRAKRLVAADTRSAALSGRFWGGSHPGLKPWAVLLDYFMVKASRLEAGLHQSPITNH
jgi:hypothetical protein